MAQHPLAHEGGGDDLDDGLELDESLLASDEEVEVDEGDGWMTDDEEVAPKKRAREEPEKEGEGEDDEKARKKRRRDKDKARRAAKRAAANGDEETADPSTLEPEAVAQLLLASVRAAMPAATGMEIDDVAVASSSILEPVPPSGEGEFAGLVGRLNDALKDAPKKPKPGCPRVLILSLSGIRCADVVRAVRSVPRPGEVAKLFAKHFKLADQIKYLAKTRVSIAVGTPARVAKLLADGALKMTPQSVVLLDIGHRDSKKRSLLTLPEVRDELWTGFFRDARAALKPAKFAVF
ncbi:hypothetical protein CC85DRAFT_286645 [Cutaneotrichosporon oleaginosum]|uniref:Protein CMS1 n=1 Tax=Cutaneotrichosporon oleaginosum TaxID=879819 RepID=A0A0J1B0S4_9TREE|nr:uncharacterized protein CC85DRAFT_286645 [Cutaneotrichosporon oleaginosum]KLT41209.1 hypothetical protein CC85DRAFT_286645 [Cutaneotrichosporon oleaginosum]TXT05475.1 hypothetical protein COLE_06795 [Cutaneotrichosporon oleaginosum]